MAMKDKPCAYCGTPVSYKEYRHLIVVVCSPRHFDRLAVHWVRTNVIPEKYYGDSDDVFLRRYLNAKYTTTLGTCGDCGCSEKHHKHTLDGWGCINCEQYCPDPPEGW